MDKTLLPGLLILKLTVQLHFLNQPTVDLRALLSFLNESLEL